MKEKQIINVDRIELFCQYYIQSNSGADAYIKAGYKVTTRASARSCSSRLLNTPRARSILNELRKRFFQENDFQGTTNVLIERENSLLKKEIERLNTIVLNLHVKVASLSARIIKLNEQKQL